MNLTDAASMARRLMNENGLGHIPFEFDRGRRRLGCTHFIGKNPIKITMSHHYTTLISDDEIKHVILHEIAHAKAGIDAGHGSEFKRVARSLGINDSRCMTPSDKPAAAWEAHCKVHGPSGSKFHRAPLVIRACGKCSPVFNVNNLLVWKKNGREIPVSEMPQRYRDAHKRAMINAAVVRFDSKTVRR